LRNREKQRGYFARNLARKGRSRSTEGNGNPTKWPTIPRDSKIKECGGAYRLNERGRDIPTRVVMVIIGRVWESVLLRGQKGDESQEKRDYDVFLGAGTIEHRLLLSGNLRGSLIGELDDKCVWGQPM